jgi:superfamily I DNA and/or RNA helicase
VNALGTVRAKQIPLAFERRFYLLWISEVMAKSDVLTTFNAAQREDLIRKFTLLDNSIRELAAVQIQRKATDPAQRLRSAQSNLAGSEVGILRRELQKRKKIKPLRKLFAEMPHALQALKPCMLMSPISVSTYLKPGSVTFDLVVFDEASQLPTPEGIAAILRAEQVVVAGDRNQLPPTSFFRAQIELDEGDENDQDDQLADEPLECLLDDAVATVPLFRQAHLKWHYRSRDERLIKFSNAFFYENRLVTFPSACTDSDGRGVRLVYVPDGVWDRGRSRTNRTEARKVAELVVEHFTRFPHRSLGVVAMNAQQKEAIEDAIAEAVEQRPDILTLMDPASGHEPFFAKSLENVQGDERDAMMISVGYGKDTNGHLSLNFGPLNMEGGGWRRLNVLITRAKWHTTLVTSIRSHELSGISPNNRGAVALRDFITYAERNCELPQPPSAPTAEETNDFEDAVATALRDRGLAVDQQVGASKFRIDLAVRDRRDPSRYVLGVECDGATYHSTRTARDRDVL